ncbi:DegT/DnrJ/EryC1/StrS family aminotransferase [Helicobacter bilis]|uniref:DegT/DnrJ/EryC1/StrS family aminotransferase n=1 Tax=Helicobacter bilis TaxID=37372 RepID=UPI0026EC5A43|nr:DegT/DnrJ/EryC1/StrS family aminotransferase [Helicobacter bilis]
MLENFIPYSTQSINDDDKEAVLNALCSTHLTQGAYTKQFESDIAAYIGIKHAISFNSATSVLYAAFYALKEYVINKKYNSRFKNAPNLDYAANNNSFSIITTPISFVATTNMMLANNITPIFADIDSNGNLDLSNLESLLREDTIAICSVDYAGNSVDMKGFSEFAKKHNLIWISDSSHAFGASYDNDKVGSKADMSIFSFHAVKPFTTCEGGALVSNDDFFARIASLVCSHGIIKHTPYNHDCITLGFNFRLHEISASLGISQLKRLESFLAKRKEIALFYDSYFKDSPYCKTLNIKDCVKSTYHLYPLLLEDSLATKKEEIANTLATYNIGVQVHYKPIYNFTSYKHLGSPKLPNAESFYKKELSIPCHQNMTLQEAKMTADYISKTFEDYAKNSIL